MYVRMETDQEENHKLNENKMERSQPPAEATESESRSKKGRNGERIGERKRNHQRGVNGKASEQHKTDGRPLRSGDSDGELR